MRAVKRLLKPLFTSLGYDIRKVSHRGLDAINDIRTIYQHKTPPVVFDIGAHRGETAEIFSNSFPHAHIHSFEPAPETFADLKRRTSCLKNVRTINAALGNFSGVSTLNVNKSTATNSLLRPGDVDDNAIADLMQPTGTSSVTVRTLDGYCAEAGIDFIDLLKMDVQGFEIQVLRGARQFLDGLQISLIFCEVSFELLYEGQPLFEDVYSEVVKSGFRLVDLYGHVRAPVESIRWCDALFVHPVALARRLQAIA